MADFDTGVAFSEPPESLSEESVVAANTSYMASQTNRAPSEVNYDAEKEVFFGADYSDGAAYYDIQRTNTGAQTEWGQQLMGAADGTVPEYNNSFWNEFETRFEEGAEMGFAMAESITASAWDIVPSWIRGAGEFAEQVAEPIPKDSKIKEFFVELSENPFVATMLETPLRWIDESGELNKEASDELRRLGERHGKGAVAVNELTKAVVDTTAFLATMRLAGVQIGMTPKQAGSKELSQQMIARLKSAGKIGIFKAVTAEAGSLQERADIMAISTMYMATPAASGVFEGARDVFVADLILNSAVTAPQIMDLWGREDIDDFDKLLESVKMVGADLAFSAMTKTMRGNKLSPNWKPMEEASRTLVERAKSIKRGEDIKLSLVVETDRLAEVNAVFSENVPKPGSSLNRIQGESDTANKNGNGFIKVEQEKTNAEEDIRLLEEKLKEQESQVTTPEGAPIKVTTAEAPKGEPKVVSKEKVAPEAQEGGLTPQGRKDVLDTINETRNLPTDEKVDAVNRAMQDAVDGKPRAKTSKIKQRVERTTGVKPPKKTIVVNEYQMLKKQLRDINRGLKEGKKLGKAEQKLAQAERDAKLAKLHKDATEYVNTVVRGKDAKNALKVKIPNIKTIEGLDKFQRDVNKALAEQARTDARNEAKEAVNALKGTKLGTELRTVADEILSGIDLKGTSDKKLTELRDIKDFLEKEGIEILPATAEKMEVLEKLRLKDMTTADLIDLKNVAKSIVHMQKQKEAMTNQGQDRTVEEKATEYVDEQRPDRMADSGLMDEKGDRIDPKTGGLLATKRTLDLTPHALLFYMDGGREGAAHELYVNNIWKGDDQRLRIEQEAHRYMEPFKDDIVGWDKATAKDGFTTKMEGKDVVISKSEKVAIYLDSLNAGNSKHVQEGGYVINNKTIKPSQKEIDLIIGSMTDRELGVASAIHKGYQNILRPAINEASNKVNGFDIANIDNYHPITTSRTAQYDKDSTPATMREYTEVLLDSSGHFKKRTGGLQPIKLQDAIDKFDKMTKLVSRYNGYAEPIALQKKFLDGRSADGTSVRETITRTYGKQYVSALENLTKDLEAGGSRYETFYGMGAFNKVVMHFGRGYLALNVGVAAGQPVSYLTAQNVIPFKHWDVGNKAVRMVPWETMGEHSSLLWSRGKGHLDIAFGESAEAKKLSKNMAMIRGMDHLAISKIWRAAESWVREDTGGADPKEIAKRVDDIVRRTQPTFETIDRPEMARNPNFRAFSMFSSVINKNHALKFTTDVEAYEKFKRGELDREAKNDWLHRTILNRAVTPTVFSFVKTATSVGFWLSVAKGEDVLESFLKKFFNRRIDSSIGESGIIASKVGSSIKYIASKDWKVITGREQTLPGIGEMHDVGGALIDLGKMAIREDEDLDYIKTDAQLKKEREQTERMMKRLIRGSLSMSGKGYQNIYDLGSIVYESVKPDKTDDDLEL